jgi:H+/Cl- antiporter ClcA
MLYRFLFLAGTSAGVSAGFDAPITGIFFALECGNRYLRKNTLKFERVDEGPRADIAAIVLAATISSLIVSVGLEGESLQIQGNSYAMNSPLFELPVYLGLGLVCGGISVLFTTLRDAFTELYAGDSWARDYFIKDIPVHLRPILGGIVCGLAAFVLPQTLFSSYSTLDQLIAGRDFVPVSLLLSLLFVKLFLTSFSLSSGLVGGIFAPSLFFGATAGAAYQQGIVRLVNFVRETVISSHNLNFIVFFNDFFVVANTPAYAAVGAAATLGALFRAPLTASMLMFEITQNHDIVLPVLASCGLAGLFAEVLSHPRRQW